MRSPPHPPHPAMDTLFLVCALLGGAVLVLQLLLSVVGLDHHEFGGLDLHMEAEGLNLTSVRALAAGLAFFGIGGLVARELGLAAWIAIPVGIAAGTGAAAAVAVLMRSLLRLQSDGTVHIEGAVGEPATVYLSIPGERTGTGKVHLALQGRMVEVQAVSRQALPTGARVVVVDVLGPDLVEVSPSPAFGGLLNASL
jgi:hypothetical protein